MNSLNLHESSKDSVNNSRGYAIHQIFQGHFHRRFDVSTKTAEEIFTGFDQIYERLIDVSEEISSAVFVDNLQV